MGLLRQADKDEGLNRCYMKKFLLIVLWAVVVLFAIDIAFRLVSASGTLANIIGVAVLALVVAVSVWTRCFTNFKFKKHENNR